MPRGFLLRRDRRLGKLLIVHGCDWGRWSPHVRTRGELPLAAHTRHACDPWQTCASVVVFSYICSLIAVQARSARALSFPVEASPRRLVVARPKRGTDGRPRGGAATPLAGAPLAGPEAAPLSETVACPASAPLVAARATLGGAEASGAAFATGATADGVLRAPLLPGAETAHAPGPSVHAEAAPRPATGTVARTVAAAGGPVPRVSGPAVGRRVACLGAALGVRATGALHDVAAAPVPGTEGCLVGEGVCGPRASGR